jgi:formylglycine-generating enzyme required for sulfatase activity
MVRSLIAALFAVCVTIVGAAAAFAQKEPAPAASKPEAEACNGGLLVSVSQPPTQPCIKPGSGESFKDCAACPEMVVVPAGSFLMGSTQAEVDALVKEFGKDHEKFYQQEMPQHRMTIGSPFAVGQFSITVSEYMACVKDGGCKPPEWDEPGSPFSVKTGWNHYYKRLGDALTGDRYPIVGVSWHDARAYATWLSGRTSKNYRLLSEAEFEYAARAGTTAPFWWGKSISTDQANYDGNYSYAGSPKGEDRGRPVLVRSFEPNPWGLYQVHGNVWSWTQDCWNSNNANVHGNVWTWMQNWWSSDCDNRVVRGGSWESLPDVLRSARRDRCVAEERSPDMGFRVARTLTP